MQKRLFFLKIPHPRPNIKRENNKAQKNNKSVVLEGGEQVKAQKRGNGSRSAAKRTVDEKTVHQASAKQTADPRCDPHIERQKKSGKHCHTVPKDKIRMSQFGFHSLTSLFPFFYIVAQKTVFEKSNRQFFHLFFKSDCKSDFFVV
jgi:hypothetical protein